MSVSERSPGGRDRERTYSLGSSSRDSGTGSGQDIACTFLPRLTKENIVSKLSSSHKASSLLKTVSSQMTNKVNNERLDSSGLCMISPGFQRGTQLALQSFSVISCRLGTA